MASLSEWEAAASKTVPSIICLTLHHPLPSEVFPGPSLVSSSRSSTQGEKHHLLHSQGKTLRCGWMTGCHHSYMPSLGMSGQTTSCHYNWQDTFRGMPYRSGVCWGRTAGRHKAVQLRVCKHTLTLEVVP